MTMVHCRGCGKEVHESAPICPSCGAAQQVFASTKAVGASSDNGKSILKWLGILVFAGLVILGMLIIAGSSDESSASPDRPAAHVSKLDELAAMPAAPLLPTGELASMFNLMSEYTDLQRENKLKEIKGKVVEWSLTVYEIEREGDGYSIQAGDSLTDELALTHGNEVGTLIHVSPRNEQDNAVIATLKTGSRRASRILCKRSFSIVAAFGLQTGW